MRHRPDWKAAPDDQLLRGLFDVLGKTRHDEADLVAHVAEVGARKLYARQASPSMFAWCTETLHLSEAEAYLRIGAARASRRHPMLLAMLADGRLHLSGIERLAPHLTEENRHAVLKRAVHRTKRQIEELVAELSPRPAAPTRMRKLPARRGPEASGCSTVCSELRPNEVARLDGVPAVDGAPSATGELRLDGVDASLSYRDGASGPGGELRPDGAGVSNSAPAVGGAPSALRPNGAEPPPVSDARPTRAPEAVAPDRFRLQFDLSTEFRDELVRLQALVRSSVPDGDLSKVVHLAVRRELERLEAKRFGKTTKPRTRLAQADTRAKSRHIPAAVRRFVEDRDGGQCTYQDKRGRRCRRHHDLEFHHTRPFAAGGDHSPGGIVLMCRTHNQLLADQDCGKEKMERARRRGRSDSKGAEVISEGTRQQHSGAGAVAVRGVGSGHARTGLSWLERGRTRT